MNYEIVTLEAMDLIGMNYYGDPFSCRGGWDHENEIGKTWKRFVDYHSLHPQIISETQSKQLYELHVYNDKTPETGEFEVFVGGISAPQQTSILLVSKQISEKKYLKLTLFGDEILADYWNQLLEIANEMNLKLEKSYLLQCYDQRFKGMDKISDSILDVLIPLV